MMEGDRSVPDAINPDVLADFQQAYQNLDLFPLVEPDTIERFRVEYGREVLVRLRQEVNASVKDQKAVAQIADPQAQDPDSPLLASLYQSLGIAYHKRLEQGIAVNRKEETEKAIAALNTAIALQESAPDPTPLATSLSYLASLYRLQGRYSEAEPLYVRSLAIKEAQLGPDHPSTATSLNNLAGLYKSMGRYTEAELLYVRSLEIRQTQLGPDHLDVAQSLNNLAEWYRSMGRYAEAEPLFVRSLKIRQAQLGPDHPDTAKGLNNLAGLYESMGRYSEAELLVERSLEIYEAQLG